MPTAAAVTAFLGQYAHSRLGCVQLREYMHTLCTIKSICAHTLCAIKPSLALIGYQRTRNNHHMVIMWWLRYSLVKGQTNKGWFSINDIFRRFAQIRVWGCSILKKWQLSDFWRRKKLSLNVCLQRKRWWWGILFKRWFLMCGVVIEALRSLLGLTTLSSLLG